ncbi:hypothetical protein cyc_03155 [Cyclospora cayetanensis]|uniref:Uncharacterized protein n=1 Tax=Cyclospora cayetanensis TaxID=88456 RepID=A0A1D3DAH5_9EIME|nr:hypothetical protein cyc_03155 [Cyclospora cayetanensis]
MPRKLFAKYKSQPRVSLLPSSMPQRLQRLSPRYDDISINSSSTSTNGRHYTRSIAWSQQPLLCKRIKHKQSAFLTTAAAALQRLPLNASVRGPQCSPPCTAEAEAFSANFPIKARVSPEASGDPTAAVPVAGPAAAKKEQHGEAPNEQDWRAVTCRLLHPQHTAALYQRKLLDLAATVTMRQSYRSLYGIPSSTANSGSRTEY